MLGDVLGILPHAAELGGLELPEPGQAEEVEAGT
jgi:hypothetical protein